MCFLTGYFFGLDSEGWNGDKARLLVDPPVLEPTFHVVFLTLGVSLVHDDSRSFIVCVPACKFPKLSKKRKGGKPRSRDT